MDRSIKSRALAFFEENVAARKTLLNDLYETADGTSGSKRKISSHDMKTHNFIALSERNILNASSEV